jgi:hypothetical protein
MRPFINHELLAPNVMTVSVDAGIVDEFADLGTFRGTEYVLVSPGWKSDVEWLSASSPSSFEIFQSAFDRLGVADHVLPYVDIDTSVQLYAGFLVIRSKCSAPNFHLDWRDARNQAFTMITPVSLEVEEFGLLYKKLTGEVGSYDYKSGEAILFGDHFLHSTKPGAANQPIILLSFVFGTDRMQHWGNIYRTIGKQTPLLRRPDGEFVGTEIAFARPAL